VQIALGVAVPLVFGAIVGIVLGVSAGAYWGLRVLAGLGGVGLVRAPGRDGAEPTAGWSGGVCSALGILIAHAIAGTHAKVSLAAPAAVDRDRAIFACCWARWRIGSARNLRERNAPV